MLYIDKLVYSPTGLTFCFDNRWAREDVHGLTDTHDKSYNWNDLEDGLWDKLILENRV